MTVPSLARAPLFLALALAFLVAPAGPPGASPGDASPFARAAADERERAPARLHAWGQVDPVRGAEGRFELTYVVRRPGQRPVQRKALLELAERLEVYVDRAVPLTALEKDDMIWVLGRAQERDTQTPEGTTVTDRQLNGVSVLAVGDALEVNTDYTDPRDPGLAWVEVRVTRPGNVLFVQHEGNEWRVVMARAFAVLSRQRHEGKEAPPLRRGTQAEVWAERMADEDGTPVYRVTRLALHDRRLRAQVYPLLLE